MFLNIRISLIDYIFLTLDLILVCRSNPTWRQTTPATCGVQYSSAHTLFQDPSFCFSSRIPELDLPTKRASSHTIGKSQNNMSVNRSIHFTIAFQFNKAL